MDQIAGLQRYLRWSAAQAADAIAVPPFTLLLQADAANRAADHAVPDAPIAGAVAAAVAELRGVCASRGRELRVRFVHEFAPALGSALAAAGLALSASIELLGCTADTLRTPPPVPGLTMVPLDSGSALDDVREGLDTNELGFDPAAAPVSDELALAFRAGLLTNQAFTARVDGMAAGAGMYNPPHAGVTELVGITTLQRFRGRGVAAALTAYAARAAFAHGAELVFLTTDNPVARRVYRRLGFRALATLVTYQAAPRS